MQEHNFFAKQWSSSHGFTAEQIASMQAGAPKAHGISFVALIAMSAVLSHILNHLGAHDWKSGALWAAHIWLGFAATIGLMAYLYAGPEVCRVRDRYGLPAALSRRHGLDTWRMALTR
ncbi:MAG: DUF1761 domain-containing protein [Gemmatimonadaceae bacterium]